MTIKRHLAGFVLIFLFAIVASLHTRWAFEQGFDVGVKTSLCAMDVALETAVASEPCSSLSGRQRAYAEETGREIRDHSSRMTNQGSGE